MENFMTFAHFPRYPYRSFPTIPEPMPRSDSSVWLLKVPHHYHLLTLLNIYLFYLQYCYKPFRTNSKYYPDNDNKLAETLIIDWFLFLIEPRQPINIYEHNR